MTRHRGAPGNRRPMAWWLAAFCGLVRLLDYVPRYGRVFTWVSNDKSLPDSWGRQWRFMRYGNWGISILDSLGLIERYAQHIETKWKRKSGLDE